MKATHIALGLAFLFSAILAVQAQSATPDWSKAKEVGIVMTNFAFTPDTVQFEIGVPYRLHFTNNGSSDHSFSDSQLFASATIAAEDAGKIHDGTVEVPEGQIVDIRFVATKPGSYRFHCSHFLHASFGMRGTAIVQ